MKLVRFDFVPEIRKMKTYVDGLFPDPELNRIAVELVNQNWQAMYKSMIDEAMKIGEPILIQRVNQSFLRIPFRKMFV